MTADMVDSNSYSIDYDQDGEPVFAFDAPCVISADFLAAAKHAGQTPYNAIAEAMVDYVAKNGPRAER